MNRVSTLDLWREQLVNIFSEKTYHYVYVSLGSKINEANVSFSYPSSGIVLNSNAEFQMIPMFIREQPETNNILCIIIDDFHDKNLAETNNIFLETIRQRHQNISTLVFNERVSLTGLKDYLTVLLNILMEHKICATRFMFTNFICFKHPNPMQLTFESKLPEVIHRSFDSFCGGYYKNCYYQWFNYAYYTYNYIYCYRDYNIQRLMSIQHLHMLMKTCIKNDTLDSTNCEIITNYTKNLNNSSKKKWEAFLNHCINFAESN
jgi:hypothetical protein